MIRWMLTYDDYDEWGCENLATLFDGSEESLAEYIEELREVGCTNINVSYMYALDGSIDELEARSNRRHL